MRRYRVEVEGRNVLVELGGRFARRGFFILTVVEAADPGAAASAAVEAVRGMPQVGRLARNGPGDPPVLEVASVIELGPPGAAEAGGPGLVWYDEGGRGWWPFRGGDPASMLLT